MRATITIGLLVSGALVASCSSGDEFESGAGASGGNDGGGATGGKAGSSSGGASGSSGASGSGTGGSSGSDGSGGVSGSSGSSSGGDSGSGNAGAGGGSAGGSSAGGSNTGGTNPGGSGGTGGMSSGGAGGTGGSSTGGTGGSSTGGSSGSGGGAQCNWNDPNLCPVGTYCNALGCAEGTCTPFPNPGINKNPVCGCDGITYWNASVAGSQGMSAKSAGECTPGIFCGGIAGIECPAGHCNYELPDALGCDISHATGTCWIVPSSCSGIGFGPNTRACDSPSCTDQCKLISSQAWYYVDNTCPQ